MTRHQIIPADHSPPDHAGARIASFTNRQKAAVIVRLLLSQGVAPALDRLSADQQADLARTMAGLGPVNRATLAAIVREFTWRLDDLGLIFPNALPATLRLLEPHLSETVRDGLRREAGPGANSAAWDQLAALEPDRLRPILERESAEICAVLLSKLNVAKAAILLADLPADRAHVVAHAVSLTATVTPQMVDRIGASLLDQIQAAPRPAFKASAVDRVGAMLNSASAAAREAILDGLTARDARFADDVRRAIFTFEHIPKRVEAADVPRILRTVNQDTLIIALAAGFQAAPLTVEFLLENMSKRMAEQLRDEASGRPAPRPEHGEPAMAAIVNAIREMEEAGDIRLIRPDE
jgi:flagellar motor switch protein FliG